MKYSLLRCNQLYFQFTVSRTSMIFKGQVLDLLQEKKKKVNLSNQMG